jgi:hypothetical protein
MEPLREPCVNIERESRMREGGERSLIERHCVFLQALEVVKREPNDRWPQNPLPLVARKPQVKTSDNLRVNLRTSTVARIGESDQRG